MEQKRSQGILQKPCALAFLYTMPPGSGLAVEVREPLKQSVLILHQSSPFLSSFLSSLMIVVGDCFQL